MEERSLSRYIIGSSRIRYEVLDELFRPISTEGRKAAVFLADAHTIFSRLQSRERLEAYEESLESAVIEITVGFLNVLGHYRRYLATRLGLDNVIYAFFNPIGSRYHQELVPDYANHITKAYDSPERHGFANAAIAKAWEFILGLSPYFEGLYCINAPGIDTHSLMRRLIPMRDNGNLFILFSGSEHTLQLVSNRAFQLTNARDKSKLIGASGVYPELLDRTFRRLEKERRPDQIAALTPDLLPSLWAIAGCQAVDVPPMRRGFGLGKTVSGLLEAMDCGKCGSRPSVQTVADVLGFRDQMKEIQKRFRALNLDISAAALTKDQIARVIAQIYDVFDWNSLEELNNLLSNASIDPELLELRNLTMSRSQDSE